MARRSAKSNESPLPSASPQDGLLWMLLPFALALVHLTSLGNDFVWDDVLLVVENPVVQGEAGWKAAFTTAAFGADLGSGTYYRPMQSLSLLFDVWVWGNEPAPVRATNVLLHALSAALVFLLFRSMAAGRPIWVALVPACIFAVHPAGVEAVDYVASRGDVLGLTLGLCAMWLAWLGRRGASLVAIVLFVAAFFSKEHYVFLPGVFAAAAFALGQRRLWKTAVSSLVVAFGYAGFLILRRLGETDRPLSIIASSSLRERILTTPEVLLEYVSLLLWPAALRTERHFVNEGVSLGWLLGILLSIGFVVVLIRGRRRDPLGWVFVLWFAAGLAPFLPIVFPLTATVAERWVYGASIGFWGALVVALGRGQLLSTKRGGVVAAVLRGVLCLGLSARTVDRISDWKDAPTLFGRDLRHSPNSFLLHHNLGVCQLRAGDVRGAKQSFEQAIAVAPGAGYGTAFNSLGSVVELEGDLDRAGELYYRSIQLSRDRNGYLNLARMLIDRGDDEVARDLLREAVGHYPMDVEIVRALERLRN